MGLIRVKARCEKNQAFVASAMNLSFSHFNTNPSISVIYITPQTGTSKQKPTSLGLNINRVVTLHRDENQLTTGSLYEMRARYPIIDAAGYLEEIKSGKKWHVFIQLSIKDHTEHKSMCEVFHRAPRGTFSQLPKDDRPATIYEYYRYYTQTKAKHNRVHIHQTQQSLHTPNPTARTKSKASITPEPIPVKVLLLYISPKQYIDPVLQKDQTADAIYQICSMKFHW